MFLARPRQSHHYLLIALVALSGCFTRAGDQHRRGLIDHVQHGDLVAAQAQVDDFYDCDEQHLGDKHGLLWAMQRARLAQLGGDYSESEGLLDTAAELVDEHRAKRISGIVGSAAVNETLKSYDGQGYEHLLVDYFRSLSALVTAQQAEGLVQLHTPALLGGLPVTGMPTLDAQNPAPVYDRAIGFVRRAVLDQLPRIQWDYEHTWMVDARVGSAPFLHLYAIASILAAPTRTEGDQQFADAMASRCEQAYRQQRQVLSQDERIRYEVQTEAPAIMDLLTSARRLYAGEAPMAPGEGLVLVLVHRDLVTRQESLDIRIRTGAGVYGGLFSLSDRDRDLGLTVSQITLGPLQVAAKGPGSEVINFWPPLLVGPKTIEAMGTANKVIGFSLPVYRPDQPIAASVPVRVGPSTLATQVVADIDALARATLKDQQPRLATKTLVRVVAKQAAVHAGAEAMEREQGKLAGVFASLVGSAAMTATEIADLRSWFLLPNHISATLHAVPAGEHTVQLPSAAGATPVATVQVPAGRLVVVPVALIASP